MDFYKLEGLVVGKSTARAGRRGGGVFWTFCLEIMVLPKRNVNFWTYVGIRLCHCKCTTYMYSICTSNVNIKLAPDTPCAQSAADLQADASAADLSWTGARSMSLNEFWCREHEFEWILMPGAWIWMNCDAGSMNLNEFWCREHEFEWILMPGARIWMNSDAGSINLNKFWCREMAGWGGC